MSSSRKDPRILIVTPEVTYLPDRMGSIAHFLTAKAGGLADVSAALITALFEEGADVHIALPDYRSIFSDRLAPFLKKELNTLKNTVPSDRIHLVEDRAFFYLNRIYGDGTENIKLALTFQRDVINYIIPRVQPDLIHCNDWMTALIPALARELEIPSLFTIHNIHTMKATLAYIEDRGIDVAAFWRHLFFDRVPYSYAESWETNPLDFLASGVFAAHFVNTVSPTFLKEITDGRHEFVEPAIQGELKNKYEADCAVGILNAPDPSFNPENDPALTAPYTPATHAEAKRKNKRFLQDKLGLQVDPGAPLFFWPSRLDNIQKGCQLLADILYKVISTYWESGIQIVFVANGDYQRHFREITRFHGLADRVAVCDFDEKLEHQAYAASDFMLMPSRFEPCGLPQMIAPIYGSLPVAHDTGGIHDTITHIDVANNRGNGFLFEVFDSDGLFWAINEAMHFFALDPEVRHRQIERVMKGSLATFNHSVTARQYIDLYEKMLQRPLITPYV